MQRSIPVAAGLGLALLLTSCSSDSDDNKNDNSASPSASETQKLEGSITVWVDETRINDIEPVVEEYKKERGVDVEVVQKISGDIRTDFVQQVPTGEGPDVIIGANDWLGEFVTNGVVAPIELGDVADGFNPGAITAFTQDGQLYGVPYAIENIALVRNNAIATDTPETFDALIEQGKSFGSKYPVLLQQGDKGDAYHMLPIQSSFGAQVFKQDADGAYLPEVADTTEQGTKFLEYVQKLGKEKILDTNIGGDQAKEAFLASESAYIITGPWYVTEFVDAGLDVSVLPVPSAGGETSYPFIGVQGAFISSKSANAVLAQDFVTNFIATEDGQDALYETGGRTPALKASADKVEDPILAGFGEYGANGVPQPAFAEMPAIWNFWGSTLAQVISGQASAPAAAWTTMIDNVANAFNS